MSGEWHCEKRPFSKNETLTKENENVHESGCLSIVVLGASGDLAKKKTFPALFNLYRQVNWNAISLLFKCHCYLLFVHLLAFKMNYVVI